MSAKPLNAFAEKDLPERSVKVSIPNALFIYFSLLQSYSRRAIV